ncbi:MAG: enolase C-terminal domain-like protein [Bryobacteraceae bacterium]|nr:enolase C-terminal domain-like protein [Bryobacteraceae bacterium]
MLSEAPVIRSVDLYPVLTGRLYGEPSQHILLRLTASDGSTGWGEISDVSHLPAMQPDAEDLQRVLASLLAGRSAMDTNGVEDLMLANFPGTRFHGKACLVRAGVSIAMHDLKARLLGISVAELLGGARRTRVPICYPIFRMKSRADVADRIRLVSEQFDRGFSAFRFYFGSNTDADCELLESICGRYGKLLTLTSLDGSGLFTLPAFLRAYKRLSQFPFESIESPVDRDDVELIAEARTKIDHPVSEHVRSPEYAVRLIRHRAVDIFNISITVAGGIQGMLRLFQLADSANLECLIGTTQELSVATAAQAHVGAAAPRLDYASDPVGPSLYTHDVTRERVRFEDGDLLLPEGPGLGVDVDLGLIHAIAAPLSSVNDVKTSFSRG